MEGICVVVVVASALECILLLSVVDSRVVV